MEVSSLRGENQTVTANPDGTFTATVHLEPVRVQRPNGTWAAMDTTLRAQPDGSIRPVAITVDMTFSGGGNARLAQIADSGKSLRMDWTATLPTPSLDGDTATYAEVYPGVDLQVRATADGFSELLVVKTPEVASNPALASVRFPVTTSGAGGPTHFAVMPTAVEPAAVRVMPDQDMLTAPDTKYPVYIDPSWTRKTRHGSRSTAATRARPTSTRYRPT